MTRRLIINLRGAGGSGKTTLVRHMVGSTPEELNSRLYTLRDYEHRPGGSKGEAKRGQWPVYRCDVPGLALPVYVQGSYRQAQGGCDTCKDMDAIERMIWAAVTGPEYQDGHVLFEGMVVSGSAERWCIFNTRTNKTGLGTFTWLFLMIDKETMVRRIMERNGGRMPQVQHMDESIRKQERSYAKAKTLLTDRRFLVKLDAYKEPDALFGNWVKTVASLETT